MTTSLADDAQIRRASAIFLITAFVPLITLPPLYDSIHRPTDEWNSFRVLRIGLPPAFENLSVAVPGAQGWLRSALDFLPRLPKAWELTDFADKLARDSEAGRVVRPYYQWMLTRGFGEGARHLVVGRDGFLFYRMELGVCTGTAILEERMDPRQRASAGGANSVAGIIDFNRQVKANGIHLLVLPATLGPVLYPEKLWPGYPSAAGPAWDGDFQIWKQRLVSAGVDLFDPTELLWRARDKAELPWVPTDSHWSPHGVELVADQVARRVRPFLGPYPPQTYQTRRLRQPVLIDLRHLLELPSGPLVPPAVCNFTQVLQDGRPVPTGDDKAAVLLMGDSFSAVYSGMIPDDLVGADLARQLMLRLRTPVQADVKYGVDPLNGRAELWGQVSSLLHKRVIIWEFSCRHLLHPHTWQKVPFPPVQRLRAQGYGG